MGLLSDIITREQWGAKPPKSPATPHTPKRIVIHHSAVPRTTDWRGVETMRAIQRFHQADQGWADIGYHLVLAPDGLYAGRPLDVVGAHCGLTTPAKAKSRIVRFSNTGSIGVCVIGNFDVEPVPEPTGYLLKRLIIELCEKFGIVAGQVFGHFDVSDPAPKTCPGENLAKYLGWHDRWLSAFPKRT
jgi:N-acetylmuramoyl-L-alanine amidase CwlA